ncbi:MAG: LuxR C-terminal-related transcriptional regulator [Planctomycetes bacterium]|nr:LuxR C-terminal-related transcriptional regulator [Planctomycetota bacterium]
MLKLQGFSNEEIAEQIQRTTRTVESRLKKIREAWTT